MLNAIEVHIWNQLVGVLSLNEQTVYFEYAPEFIRSGIALSPLMMALPNPKQIKIYSFPALAKQTYYGLPGLMADHLPDRFGNVLIDAYMASKGVDKRTLTPLDRLAYMGQRSMGALEFKPMLAHFKESKLPLEMSALVATARRIISGNFSYDKETKNTLMQMIRVGTSAGGARAKAVIALHPKTNQVLSGEFNTEEGYEHWLLKFDGMQQDENLGYPQTFGRIEYAYYLMAKACGINMMPCRLLEENGRAHFMTKRFDRDGNKKIHMQTLCAMYHLDFNMPNAHSYQQFFRVINALKIGHEAVTEAYRRMVFNVMACNCDDHTKNHAFLLREAGKWELSPAYDLSYAYNPEGQWTHAHQLSVNGKFKNITREDLLAEGQGIQIKRANEIIDEVQSVIRDFPRYAKEANVSDASIQEIQKNQLLF